MAVVRGVPPAERGAFVEELKPERRELIPGDPKRVVRARRTLGSMSHFMLKLTTLVVSRPLWVSTLAYAGVPVEYNSPPANRRDLLTHCELQQTARRSGGGRGLLN
ncbi:MAG: hypothetical protein OXH09_01640 [Gammaproteobacteria bacterium]|nr:hypothetical protein [Gammaproteobacteria bacterium]